MPITEAMASRKRAPSQTQKPVPARHAPTPRGVDREKSSPPRMRTTKPKLSVNASGDDFDGIAYAKRLIRDVPDYPQPGILFRDITPLLADPKALSIIVDALTHRFVGESVDAVVGIESRGFIFGAALAVRLNASFIPVRKAGKLPCRTDKVSYSLEYGEAELEMHRDSLSEGARVVVVDDLLATGGTAKAAADLVERQGALVLAYAFVIELEAMNGRERLLPTPVLSLMKYA